MVETTERENTTVTLAPALEGGRNLIYPHRTIAPSSSPPPRVSQTAADAAASGLSSEQSGR